MNISVKEARQIKTVTLTDCMVTLDEFIAVVKFGAKLEFSQQMIDAVNANHALLDKFLEEGRIIYGVTTGFGENVRYTIFRRTSSAPTPAPWASPWTGSRPGR